MKKVVRPGDRQAYQAAWRILVRTQMAFIANESTLRIIPGRDIGPALTEELEQVGCVVVEEEV